MVMDLLQFPLHAAVPLVEAVRLVEVVEPWWG